MGFGAARGFGQIFVCSAFGQILQFRFRTNAPASGAGWDAGVDAVEAVGPASDKMPRLPGWGGGWGADLRG